MLGASGGSGFFFLIIIAFAFFWFFLIRPQKKRQVAAAQMLKTLNVGDEVVTAGGIYGEVTSLLENDVMVRIAPDLEVRIAKRAIAGVLTEKPEALAPGPGTEEEGR